MASAKPDAGSTTQLPNKSSGSADGSLFRGNRERKTASDGAGRPGASSDLLQWSYGEPRALPSLLTDGLFGEGISLNSV
jgi:hypothetical protein